MNILLLIIVALAGLWDGFTTIYGTTKVLGTGPIQIAVSLLFSALVLSFLLSTRRILGGSEGGFMGLFARFFWLLALFYDLYTSWIGNSDLILPHRSTVAETVILLGLTFLVSGSTILFPFLWERRSQPDLAG